MLHYLHMLCNRLICWISYVNWLGMWCNMCGKLWSRTELIQKHNRIAQKNEWTFFTLRIWDERPGKNNCRCTVVYQFKWYSIMHLHLKTFSFSYSMPFEFRTFKTSSWRLSEGSIATVQMSNAMKRFEMSFKDWFIWLTEQLRVQTLFSTSFRYLSYI